MGDKQQLPPEGYEKREVLKKREDDLQQLAEERAVGEERYTIDPNAFDEIREIQHAISKGALEVSNAQEGFRYCWVPTVLNAQQVWQKKAVGWETVHGDHPEAKEYKTEDSSRRIGDCILMRIPDARYKQLEAYERYKAERHLLGATAELEEMGQKYRGRGLIVHTDNPEMVPQLKAAQQQQTAFSKAMARQVAGKKVDQMLRDGNVPGMPSA